MVAVPIALILIFVMLYFAFKSVKEALMIYSAIPLAAVGGVLLLWLRDLPFSISAGVGFIALFGIAVLNGIVLIEHFKELINNGYKVLVDAFKENSIENNIYIDYIEENNIHIFIDALYEANVMKFHNVNINTEKTLLISNLDLEFHGDLNNAILFPYFFVQSFVFWTGKENLSKDVVFKPLTIDEHLSANKKSYAIDE